MSMGIPPQGRPDPNAYAAQYASQNGISLEEAKAQLRAKYGDPTPPQNFMQSGLQSYYQPQKPDEQGSVSSAGIPAKGNPDEFAQKYANESGLSLEDAKADLKSKHGEPAKFSSSSAYSVPTFAATESNPPMHDRRAVHHRDKQWMKDYQKANPHLSRKEVRDAFIATFGRVPS